MKFIIDRATTKGNSYCMDEEEQKEELPPIEKAVKDFNFKNYIDYSPWVIEVEDLNDLLELMKKEGKGIVIEPTESFNFYDSKPEEIYPYTITIYDGYLE